MDVTDKAIAEVRAVKEHNEKMLRAVEEMEAERDAIIAARDKWLTMAAINGILTEGQMLLVSLAFMAGWAGGREYREGIKMWTLKRIGLSGAVVDVSVHPTGDSAKSAARRKQAIQKPGLEFKIYDPGGNFWARGWAEQYSGRLKMKWMYEE